MKTGGMHETPVLELRDVTKKYGNITAVDQLTLTVHQGEVVALLAPNGAGKTTTIDMALGLIEPTSGSVRVFGGTPRDAVMRGRLAAMMQTGGLLRDVTVRETLTMVAALQEVPDRVGPVLEQASLSEVADRRVSKCSGGEQQRVKFALALLTEPDLLFLDEPTTGMDVTTRREFWQTMHADADSGRTVVFATHYLEEAEAFADRVVMMGRGRLLADGPMTQIRARGAGRTVTATLPSGERTSERAEDSDALALRLLNEGATDLVISEPSLDDVFVSLTKEDR